MSDLDNTTPEGEFNPEPTQPAPHSEPSFEDAFSDMEASLDSVPEGDVYMIRHEANPVMYIPAFPGESITIREACGRRDLTLGSNVNAYVDQNQVALDSPIQVGTVVTLVGNVKGG